MREPIGSLLRDIRRLLELLAPTAPGAITRLALFSILEALTTLGIPYSSKQLLDSVTHASASGLVATPLSWLAVECVLASLRGISQRGVVHTTQLLQTRGNIGMIQYVLAKTYNVSFPNFENGDFVNHLARVKLDAASHSVNFGAQVFTILRTLLLFAGCLVLLWTTSVWTIPILLFAAMPMFVVDTMMGRRSFLLEHAHGYRNRQGWYIEWLMTAQYNIQELRSLGVGRWILARHERAYAPFREGQSALVRQHFRRSILPMLFSVFALYGPYMFIVIRTIKGYSSMGEMLLFVLVFQQGTLALGQLLTAVVRLFELHPYVHDVIAMIDLPEDDPESEPSDAEILKEAPELVLRDVCFTYPGGTRSVLKGLDLHVRAGETLAIVGPNGIGKSTLIKIMVGLYPIERGSITLGGFDVSTRSATWRRSNIGVVFQEPVHFEFDLASNVGCGWVPESEDKDGIRRAIAMAGADELVEELPLGLDSPMGPAFGGRDLSGGQWQRVAFARLYMRHSRLWLLDEPTSAMDPESEDRALQHLQQWKTGRTVIFVAHRFSTVRIADRIAVIDDGKVIEIGSHDELLAQGGAYAKLFDLQAKRLLS